MPQEELRMNFDQGWLLELSYHFRNDGDKNNYVHSKEEFNGWLSQHMSKGYTLRKRPGA